MTIFIAFDDFRLSRNARATWYLSHLHGELSVKKYESCAGNKTKLSNRQHQNQCQTLTVGNNTVVL